MNGPKRQCHSFLPRLTAGELLPDCPVLQKPFMPRQFVARVRVCAEEQRTGRYTPIFVGAEGTGAKDLDSVLHSIRSLPDFLRVGSAVDVAGNLSIFGQTPKKLESLLNTGGVHDHPVSRIQNCTDTP